MHVPNTVCQSTKKLWPEHQDMSKPYNFDDEVKGQRRIGIMNVHYKSSHGGLTCLIWYMYANVKAKKKLWARHESAQTDGHTEAFIYTLPELRFRVV